MNATLGGARVTGNARILSEKTFIEKERSSCLSVDEQIKKMWYTHTHRSIIQL